MIVNVEAPCLDCKDRVLNCHAKCEKYKVYKSNVEELRAKEKHEKDADFLAGRYK